MELLGKVLLLTDGLCDPSCTGELVACAANNFNASGMLLSMGINAEPAPPAPPAAPTPPPPTDDVVDDVIKARSISIYRDPRLAPRDCSKVHDHVRARAGPSAMRMPVCGAPTSAPPCSRDAAFQKDTVRRTCMS